VTVLLECLRMEGVMHAMSRLSEVEPMVMAFATAAAVARAAFPTAMTAYVATGENFPDALAGVPAAAGVDAPLLLVARDAIPAAAAEQLARLRPRRVVVLGGPAAVDPSIEATLRPAAPPTSTWPAAPP